MRSDADLELEAWREALAALALTCAQAGGSQAGELVLSLHKLLANAPRGHGWALPGRAAIEDWVAARAELVAVLAMIEHQAGYMLSHGPGGDHMATVAIPVPPLEASAEGAHGAIALVGAVAAALIGPALEHGQTPRVSAQPGARLN